MAFGWTLISIPNAHTARKAGARHARGSQPWAGYRNLALTASHSRREPAGMSPASLTSVPGCSMGKRQECSRAARTMVPSQVMEPTPERGQWALQGAEVPYGCVTPAGPVPVPQLGEQPPRGGHPGQGTHQRQGREASFTINCPSKCFHNISYLTYSSTSSN